MYEQLAILAGFIFLYCCVSGRLERTAFSGPMIFVAVGFLIGPAVLGWFPGEEPRQSLRLLADLTLAIFLFSDSANANLRTLKQYYAIPARMLLIGLPGAMLLGFVVVYLMFDALSVYEAAALAVMLAATDAALGKAVITNKLVPSRLREGLNVESGLNDGLCVPILLLFIALESGSERGLGSGIALTLLLEELGIGLLVGVGVAVLGGWLLKTTMRQGWVSGNWLPIASIAMAFSSFAIAQSLHGSGYIAAFTGGLVFGSIAGDKTHELLHSAEGIGETLALLTWLLFGIAVVNPLLDQLDWQVFAFAILSLTITRMLPIYVSLMGTGESTANRLFLGWFGPRGLASIVFAIIVLDAELPGAELMATVVTCTVFFSLILHGVSANPLANKFKQGRE